MDDHHSQHDGPIDLKAAGDRIETLLEASSSGGVVQRERAEELVGILSDVYGSGIERILEILHETGRLDDQVLGVLAEDDLVSSLLLVHGLHPYPVLQRVEMALERVRPYLGSHGGDVELLGVDEEGVVQLRLLGSCDGCPSSAVTLQLAVEGAVEEAAPEITGIEVQTPEPTSSSTPGLISVDSLRSRLDSTVVAGDIEWVEVPELTAMEAGGIGGFVIAGQSVFACAVDDNRYVYRDVCSRCAGSLAGAMLTQESDNWSVRCPKCRTGYDVRRAGANVAGGPEHLDPLPALESAGRWRVAVPAAVSA